MFSFSCFAHHVAKTADSIKGLVLVNPATSYGRSLCRMVGSLVANAPGPQTFGMAAALTLATTIPDTAMVGGSNTWRIQHYALWSPLIIMKKP